MDNANRCDCMGEIMSIVEDEVCDATEAKCFATAGQKNLFEGLYCPFLFYDAFHL